ncbi:hypothetical protein M422DRAFT_250420 [Sphaerobolus stellatus SS14]|uniref:Uncharacterized protein n=1 Tax=Sphaerobolus stellatus (strain SS14) TaxID=990650 RepID=A0A0C9VTS2_SPHS4|nr:hypothetical protein M422DRAFT_250420 [Sphaerobolus stellatus SS14]
MTCAGVGCHFNEHGGRPTLHCIAPHHAIFQSAITSQEYRSCHPVQRSIGSLRVVAACFLPGDLLASTTISPWDDIFPIKLDQHSISLILSYLSLELVHWINERYAYLADWASVFLKTYTAFLSFNARGYQSLIVRIIMHKELHKPNALLPPAAHVVCFTMPHNILGGLNYAYKHSGMRLRRLEMLEAGDGCKRDCQSLFELQHRQTLTLAVQVATLQLHLDINAYGHTSTSILAQLYMLTTQPITVIGLYASSLLNSDLQTPGSAAPVGGSQGKTVVRKLHSTIRTSKRKQ